VTDKIIRIHKTRIMHKTEETIEHCNMSFGDKKLSKTSDQIK